jgi:hypothetical protein
MRNFYAKNWFKTFLSKILFLADSRVFDKSLFKFPCQPNIGFQNVFFFLKGRSQKCIENSYMTNAQIFVITLVFFKISQVETFFEIIVTGKRQVK